MICALAVVADVLHAVQGGCCASLHHMVHIAAIGLEGSP
jgi:hypothetical protein